MRRTSHGCSGHAPTCRAWQPPLSGVNSSLAITLALSKPFFIERCPRFEAHPKQTASLPLHITSGVTSFLLQMRISAVVEGRDEACGRAAVLEVERASVDDAWVRPVPYHGGGFQGRSCHKNAAKDVTVCDKLAPYLPPRTWAALRVACDTWGTLAGVLSRAEEISPVSASARRLREALTHRPPALGNPRGMLDVDAALRTTLSMTHDARVAHTQAEAEASLRQALARNAASVTPRPCAEGNVVYYWVEGVNFSPGAWRGKQSTVSSCRARKSRREALRALAQQ